MPVRQTVFLVVLVFEHVGLLVIEETPIILLSELARHRLLCGVEVSTTTTIRASASSFITFPVAVVVASVSKILVASTTSLEVVLVLLSGWRDIVVFGWCIHSWVRLMILWLMLIL